MWVNIKELSEIVEAMDESEKGKAEPSATTPPPKSKAKQTAETPQAKLRPKRLSQQTTETPAPKRPRKTQDSAPQERAATLAAGPSILKTPERSKKKEQVWTINGSTADEEILAEMEKELGFKPFVPAAAASPFPEFVSSLVVERAAAVDSGKYGCDSEAGESGLTDVHVITGPLLF